MSTDRGYPWLKFHVSLLDDPRFMRLPDGAKALYLELYLLAGRADAGGLLVLGNETASVEDLAYSLRRDPAQLAEQLAELLAAGLLERASDGLCLPRFQDEQGPSQAEKRAGWRERQARKRAKYTEEADLVGDADADVDADVDGALALEEEEEEEEEEEVTRDSRVTNPPSPALPEEHPAIRLWKAIVNPQLSARDFQTVIAGLGDEPDRARLAAAFGEYRAEAAGRGWSLTLPAPILERYHRKADRLREAQETIYGKSRGLSYTVDEQRCMILWSDGVEEPIDPAGNWYDRNYEQEGGPRFPAIGEAFYGMTPAGEWWRTERTTDNRLIHRPAQPGDVKTEGKRSEVFDAGGRWVPQPDGDHEKEVNCHIPTD